MRSPLRNLVLAMLSCGPLLGHAQVATNVPERVVSILEEIRDGNENFVGYLQEYLTYYSGEPVFDNLNDVLLVALSEYLGEEVGLQSLLLSIAESSGLARDYLESGSRFWSYLNTNRLSEIETDIIRTRNATEESKLNLDELVYILEHYTFKGGALLVEDVSRGQEIGDAVEVLRGLLSDIYEGQISLERAIARITDHDLAAPTGENASSETYSLYQSIDSSAENTNDLQNAEQEVEFTRSNTELEQPTLTGEMFSVPHASEYEWVPSSGSVITLIPRDVFNSVAWDSNLTVQPTQLEVSITSNQQLSGWIDNLTGIMSDVWLWASDIVCILIAISVYRPFLRDMLQPQSRLPL